MNIEMKKALIGLLFLLPVFCQSQALIGFSLYQIKAEHPDKIFTIDYTNSGTKYAKTEMSTGTFVYYFDASTGLSNYCILFPKDMGALNGLVETYNSKYVITSETSWTAYLDGGGRMKITLEYDTDYELYVFHYE